MRTTVVGLVTPHVLSVIDLAKQAETAVSVDWHVRATVTKTVDELAHQYNARDLLSAYIQGLETAAQQVERTRKAYIGVLQSAMAMAERRLRDLD